MSELTDNEPGGATALDPDELEGLKLKHITMRSELNEVEQANITSGLEWLSRKRTKDILNEVFVRALHKKMFSEVWAWAGTFRKTEKNIGIDPLHIATQLRILLDDTRFWIEHTTFQPIEIAARFHHRLVQIHLFPNGNGRHARIMADQLLIKMMNAEPIDWSAGHDLLHFNDRRKEYIESLRKADARDYESLLKFVGYKVF